jgi:hypothetical protein
MSSVILIVYFDDQKMSGAPLTDHLASAGIQIQAGAMGRCIRCKEENAQILLSV